MDSASETDSSWQMPLPIRKDGKPTINEIILDITANHKGYWIPAFCDYLKTACAKTVKRKINVLSLFTGAGGLDIGFHDAGFNIVEAVEIEKKFCATLEANSGVNKYLGSNFRPIRCDIREYEPSISEPIDFMIGGPPCQTFSAAGRRAEGVLGTTEARGTLFTEYVRILETLQPKGFLFENVYGITGAENGTAWERIKMAFQKAGYTIYFRILSSSDYGVPQHRERVFIVGLKEGNYKFPRPTHGEDAPFQIPQLNARNALMGVVSTDKDAPTKVNGRYGGLLAEIPPGLNYSFFTERMGHPRPIFAWRSKFSDFLYKADPMRPVRTIKASGGQYTGPFHWENRPFTISELKRLQTFPEEYELKGNRGTIIKQIGNSVPPQIARILAVSILDQVFGVELPFNIPYLDPKEQLTFRKKKREMATKYHKKARECLKGVSEEQIIQKKDAYLARIDTGFRLVPSHEASARLRVETDLRDDTWKVRVSPLNKQYSGEFEITIEPWTNWKIPTRKIILKGSCLSTDVFVGAWKSLEYELSRHNFKADLVQLNGYYQYAPLLRCKIILPADAPSRWYVVKKVIEGIGTRKTLSKEALSTLWGVSPSDVLDHAMFLRELGYEVRNQNTNPQIRKGEYIIPYSFPTLSHNSVQLRKSLTDGRAQNG